MGRYLPYPKTHKELWNFKPDDTEECFYIEGSATFSEIKERAEDYWRASGGFKDLQIEPEYIHTRCLTYDRYDPMDYDNYLCITRIKE